ncbi:hypothetical protein WJX72_001801 [[Myrmecia] bisecta]|uniref:C-terminal processing peptidase n=1 Tax=[Myrmecia] bisecta TaxID=41462 RepID=A0AAW1PEH8_9CHLO
MRIGKHKYRRQAQQACRGESHAVMHGEQRSRLPSHILSVVQKAGAVLAPLTLAATLSLGALLPPPAAAITNEQLLYLEAWRAVDRAYVDKTFNGQSWFRVREKALKEAQLTERADTYAEIKRMLATLGDPFTRFLEPARFAALKRGTAGSVTGVGLEVGFDGGDGQNSQLVVITPSANSPADKAGIKPRDTIASIDGHPTQGMSLYEAGDLLQGQEGSEVKLTIIPHGGTNPRELTLTRQRIAFNPVTSQLCKGSSAAATASNIGYIRVAVFSKQTAENVRAAIKALQSEGAERFVLDIRNNGGGLFPAGVEVARMFLDSGDIVLIADSNGVRDSYDANGTAIEPKAPLSVLVNRGTASASEVLSGALQDQKRATIAGERTFGKGLIQTVVELSDGSGLAITVARYQTPNGVDINKVGITPDILLAQAEPQPPTDPAGFCKFVQQEGAPALFK